MSPGESGVPHFGCIERFHADHLSETFVQNHPKKCAIERSGGEPPHFLRSTQRKQVLSTLACAACFERSPHQEKKEAIHQHTLTSPISAKPIAATSSKQGKESLDISLFENFTGSANVGPSSSAVVSQKLVESDDIGFLRHKVFPFHRHLPKSRFRLLRFGQSCLEKLDPQTQITALVPDKCRRFSFSIQAVDPRSPALLLAKPNDLMPPPIRPVFDFQGRS